MDVRARRLLGDGRDYLIAAICATQVYVIRKGGIREHLERPRTEPNAARPLDGVYGRR